MKLLLVLVVVAGCGRLGFDTTESPVGGDAPVGGDCPSDTLSITESGVCIEKAQRGIKAWVDARADCANLGRRLCADAEWADGCTKLASLQEMVEDWEWVAEEDAGIAQKRGAGDCAATSSHQIDADAYGYRCCVDK